MTLFFGAIASTASAGFHTYTGDLAEEAFWRAFAGNTFFEDFESYPADTQITSLASLQLTFDELAGGGHPQTYQFSGTPYGPMQLGNFPNGINEINRWNDIIVRPMNGVPLYSLGFWNGDGQNDTLVAFAYGTSGDLLGSVGAFTGNFGGFISDLPVASVRFEGDTGDGWNHLDGLQVAHGLLGDFDIDGDRDPTDIDLLFAAQQGPVPPANAIFDVNFDQNVDSTPNSADSDADIWVRQLMHTEYGDTNLDGAVNFTDLLVVAQHYNHPTGGWASGNVDGSPGINFGDLLMIAQNYNFGTLDQDVSTLDATFVADWTLAQSTIPEPTALGVMSIALVLCRRR